METLKNRYTAPFGYAIEMGRLAIHPGESKIVRQIFADYLAGQSLKQIAESLAQQGVEYLPGESAWNKNRVKRVLEDARYLGAGEFPALVCEADFHAVQNQKQERNDRRAIPESHVSQLTLPVYCAACGEVMKRQHKARLPVQESWQCPCGAKIWLADSDLLREITEILNRLIANPALISEQQEPPDEARQLGIRRLQNEIGRQMEGFDFDRDAVQQDIFALAAAKFAALPSGPATTYLLRGLFEKSATLDAFSRELLEAAALQIVLGGGGIFLKLKNKQVVGKDDDDGSATENGAHDPGEA